MTKTIITYYLRQQQARTLGNNKLVKQVIDRFKNEKPITDEMAGGPKTTDPGHPVVSLVNSHTTKFIDYHLQFVAK